MVNVFPINDVPLLLLKFALTMHCNNVVTMPGSLQLDLVKHTMKLFDNWKAKCNAEQNSKSKVFDWRLKQAEIPVAGKGSYYMHLLLLCMDVRTYGCIIAIRSILDRHFSIMGQACSTALYTCIIMSILN